MIDYKKAGIKAFNKGDFDAAASYFSLAYEKKPDEKLLFLITLCSLAKTRRDEAMTLFEIFKLKDKLGMSPADLDEILGGLEAKIDEDEDHEEQNAISYADFMDAVRRGGFKSVFEDIMFSTRVMIDNRDDFLEFLQNLIKNGFIEMGLSYIETAAVMFAGDERLSALAREINERAQNENLR